MRRVPVLHETHEGERTDHAFGAFDFPVGTLHNEAHRHQPDPEPTAQGLQSIVSFLGSGALQLWAGADIAGVPLQQVLTNVIIAERFTPFAEASPVPGVRTRRK